MTIIMIIITMINIIVKILIIGRLPPGSEAPPALTADAKG